MTLPSATQFPAIAWKRGVTDAVYPDHSALLWDIVEIMKAELAALAAEGVAYIQIDAPRYSYFMDPKWREWIRSEMRDGPRRAARRVDPRRQRLPRGRAAARASRWRCTCAAATTAATGTPRAATTRSRRSSSARMAWTASCWSTTTSARARFEPLRFVPQGKAGRAGPRQLEAAASSRSADVLAAASRRLARTCRWRTWR